MGYTFGGNLYEPLKELVDQTESNEAAWGRYEQGRQVWKYLEFGARCDNWKRFRRALFCLPLYEDALLLLHIARPDTVLVTNLGMGQGIDATLVKAGYGQWLQAQGMLAGDHGRGSDELVHRALKDFGFEQPPFKRFAPNAAFYYTMLLAFFLYETFKLVVCTPVVEPVCYATTLRRRVIDIPAKIVRHGGRVVLKVTAAIFEALNLEVLWQKSGRHPNIAGRKRLATPKS